MMGDADASVGIMISSTHPGLPHPDPSISMFLVQQINLCLDAQKSVIRYVIFNGEHTLELPERQLKKSFSGPIAHEPNKSLASRHSIYFVKAPMRLWEWSQGWEHWPRECCLNVWPGINLHNLMQSYLFCCHFLFKLCSHSPSKRPNPTPIFLILKSILFLTVFPNFVFRVSLKAFLWPSHFSLFSLFWAQCPRHLVDIYF